MDTPTPDNLQELQHDLESLDAHLAQSGQQAIHLSSATAAVHLGTPAPVPFEHAMALLGAALAPLLAAHTPAAPVWPGAAPWLRVTMADECSACPECDEPVCPHCSAHYASCACPGPGQDDMYEYEVDAREILWARRLPPEGAASQE